jgi:hypothetical protein
VQEGNHSEVIMIKKLLRTLALTLGLTLGLNGCATMAVALVTCGPYGSCDAPPEVLDAAWAADSAILGTLARSVAGVPSPPGTVSLHGVVTADGAPVVGARVELLSHVGTVAVVHTGSDGSYEIPEISTVVGECSGLRLAITHPDERQSDSIQVECGEQRIEYGFTTD